MIHLMNAKNLKSRFVLICLTIIQLIINIKKFPKITIICKNYVDFKVFKASANTDFLYDNDLNDRKNYNIYLL